MLCVLHDLTRIRGEEEKRRILEAALMQSKKMEAIGQMTGGIAHDFNNILAAILGNVTLARNHSAGSANDTLRQYLDEIWESGSRARELVAQLLTFGRNQPSNATHGQSQ